MLLPVILRVKYACPDNFIKPTRVTGYKSAKYILQVNFTDKALIDVVRVKRINIVIFGKYTHGQDITVRIGSGAPCW